MPAFSQSRPGISGDRQLGRRVSFRSEQKSAFRFIRMVEQLTMKFISIMQESRRTRLGPSAKRLRERDGEQIPLFEMRCLRVVDVYHAITIRLQSCATTRMLDEAISIRMKGETVYLDNDALLWPQHVGNTTPHAGEASCTLTERNPFVQLWKWKLLPTQHRRKANQHDDLCLQRRARASAYISSGSGSATTSLQPGNIGDSADDAFRLGKRGTLPGAGP